MTFAYEISEDDYVGAMMLGSSLKLRSLVRLGVLILLFVAFVVWFNLETLDSILGTFGGIVLFVVLYLFVLRRFVVPSSIRKYYRKYKLIQEPMSVRLSENGIELTSASTGSRLQWDCFLGWRENDEYFLLALAPRMYQILPKRIAAEGFDFDQLRSRLEAAGQPAI